MPGRRLLSLPLLAALLLGGASAPGQVPAPLRIGVLAPDGPRLADREWARVAAELERALPEFTLTWRYEDLPGLEAAVRRREVDFVVTNSGHYVELESAHGAHRIATLERPEALSPTEALASAVVVAAERRELQGLDDLRGRRVQAVAPNAFGGWQIAWRELQARGLDPARDLAELRFTGFPLPEIVRAVRDGRTDVGIVRACLLEEMAQRGEIRLDAFRVLGAPAGDRFPCLRSTRLYPDWPFAALPHTPHTLSKRVATALLALPAAPGELAWTVPTDYQAVHELFRELQIGPYARLREVTLGELAARYRGWLALGALLVIGFAVHAVRVETLVQRRTQELRTALQAQREAERQARAQQDKLDHLARLGILGELSSMLAHELNQPLAAIGNFARGLERRVEAGRLEPAPLLQGSREIAEQADRAGAIMRRIRGFARKRPGERAPLRLRDAVDSAATLFGAIGVHAPVLRLRVDPAARVRADRLQIEEVVLNLLKNALDALQALPAEQRLIEVECQDAGADWRLCVRDNGSGLDADGRARLFEPFFTTKPEGLGLGLAICKTIVEAHGGRLSAQANPNAPGLCVCATLPKLDDDAADA